MDVLLFNGTPFLHVQFRRRDKSLDMLLVLSVGYAAVDFIGVYPMFLTELEKVIKLEPIHSHPDRKKERRRYYFSLVQFAVNIWARVSCCSRSLTRL